MDSDDRRKVGIGCASCLVFVGIILFAIAWDSVDPTEYGIKYNTITKSIDEDNIYDGGRYCIGVFTKFVKFPRIKRTIEFSTRSEADAAPLRTRTAEGLALGLHVAFQFELIKNEIPALYALANVNYEATFIRIARDVILQTAGSYTAPQYWKQRTMIGLQMKDTLNKELASAHARCVMLQILNIELPDTYEASIVDTQIEQQYTQMKRFEQEAALIRKQIDILTSEAQQNVTITNATAQAEAYSLRQGAEALAQENAIKAENDAYKQIRTDMDLSPAQLDQYIFYNSLQDKNSKLFVGFKNNMFMNNNNQ